MLAIVQHSMQDPIHCHPLVKIFEEFYDKAFERRERQIPVLFYELPCQAGLTEALEQQSERARDQMTGSDCERTWVSHSPSKLRHQTFCSPNWKACRSVFDLLYNGRSVKQPETSIARMLSFTCRQLLHRVPDTRWSTSRHGIEVLSSHSLSFSFATLSQGHSL